MGLPALKLNLAPPSNLWRNNHVPLGWTVLVLGGLVLAGSLGFTWSAYRSAAISGKLAGNLAGKTRSAADAQGNVLSDLRSIDVAKELPRWRLAERIFTERSLPWSRLTSELERCMVRDMRVKSVQRNRGNDQRVQLKIKGEARSREAEARFIETLQKNAFFDQIILEREGERQGGGVDFDCTLVVSDNPPAYSALPKFEPLPKGVAALPAAVPARPGAAVPGFPQARPGAVPARPAAAVPAPARTPRAGLAVPEPAEPHPNGANPPLGFQPAPGTVPQIPSQQGHPFHPVHPPGALPAPANAPAPAPNEESQP
jgi:hypothetical protein